MVLAHFATSKQMSPKCNKSKDLSPTYHFLRLLLVYEDSGHTHATSDAHARYKYLCTSFLCDVVTGRDLTCTSCKKEGMNERSNEK